MLPQADFPASFPESLCRRTVSEVIPIVLLLNSVLCQASIRTLVGGTHLESPVQVEIRLNRALSISVATSTLPCGQP